ncbi:dihydroorotate dehydrogenase electron transfer subunit [Streptacidiphilus jiangxiensis]|uniref:Dihydroorotate dehydrogenase electron transfer subunit n=1 Tax=Streptacidiphilus jiangxiensis TaxID=235985 RepID=A0A1H7YHR1_STRJI|nr:dihydroorotate dehydrogenase electron transfer subunit [Streptacidiphilus jiangxiensis]SEM45776.1 dihydroorotate dehydrogenase electron transfer subunit [Streptacidiphilus jiangxiensis]
MAHPVQRQAEIVELSPVGAYHRLVLQAEGIAERVLPGHFAALAVDRADGSLLLRRPFFIHRADPAAETIEIVLAEVGPGTRALARQRVGDTVDVVAPLGTSYSVPTAPASALLVGVGYGGSPLFGLADRIVEQGGSVGFILGASTAERLFGVEHAKALTPDVLVTTDDGTFGIRGQVTLPLTEAMRAIEARVVYASGPRSMLRAVAEVCSRESVRCFTAVEETMACGVGVCMTCVLPVVGDDGESRFVRSCVDGPCFDGSRVRWDDIGSVPADLEGAAAMGGL